MTRIYRPGTDMARMFALAALLLAALPLQAEELPLASCAWLRAENDGAGSGFVIDAERRLLVTCRHLLGDRKQVDVYFPWYREGELVSEAREYLRNRELLRKRKLLVTGTLLKQSDDLDLALIQVDALPPGCKAVVLADRPPQTGESLRVVGHRLDLDTIWNITTGPLRCTGSLTDGYFWRGKKLAANAPVLIGQLPIEEGDSGGPVFTPRGEVVGMICALRRQCPLAAVAISVEAIRAFAGMEPIDGKSEPCEIVQSLQQAAVWVKPTATDISRAGALIDNDLVLTSARGLVVRDRVGVAFPLRDDKRLVSERSAYSDPLMLHLRGAWRSGIVLARDPTRDLALIKLDSPHDLMKPLKLAPELPKAGDELHTINHPGGLEFAWVYASGAVRQQGKLALLTGEQAKRVAVLVCQLPAQTGSPGGPIVSAKGELVGILSAREGAQMVGYCVTADEIRLFLDISLRNQPAKTISGLRARFGAIPTRCAQLLAHGFAKRAEMHRAAGQLPEAERDCDSALALDPGCTEARLCRARMLPEGERMAELDIAIEKGDFHHGALLLRAELAAAARNWRKARSDLERLLDVYPADAEARQRLVGVLLGLGENAKAANAIRDTLRADATRLPAVAADLLLQADALQMKFPDLPSAAADWLAQALTAAASGTSDKQSKTAIAALLKAAGEAKTESDRLRVLRTGVKQLR